MTSPITFDSKTPRHGFPNLFAGQAQKEFTVNEAFALLDALLHAVIEGQADAPPASAVDGQCWIVGEQPTGEWSGQTGQIACRQAGNWLFVQPADGFSAFDRSAGALVRYQDGWKVTPTAGVPEGGTTIDTEARQAIEQIVSALSAAGIIAQA